MFVPTSGEGRGGNKGVVFVWLVYIHGERVILITKTSMTPKRRPIRYQEAAMLQTCFSVQ